MCSYIMYQQENEYLSSYHLMFYFLLYRVINRIWSLSCREKVLSLRYELGGFSQPSVSLDSLLGCLLADLAVTRAGHYDSPSGVPLQSLQSHS